MLHRLLIPASVLLLVVVGVITFNAPAAPPVLVAGNTIPGIAQWNFAELPQRQSLKARDGAPLNYRRYPGQADQAVVLVLGSTGSGLEMHKFAQALQAAGATVYAISLRGHGGSGTTNGDVSYRGHSTTTWPISLLDLGSNGWAGVALPRLLALSLLDRIGLSWFQGLPVVAFATAAKADDNRTPVYSLRLQASLQLGRDWRVTMASIAAPTRIVIGARDELFKADQFQPLLQEINQRIGVTVAPDEGHLGMLADPPAMAAITAAWRQLAGI